MASTFDTERPGITRIIPVIPSLASYPIPRALRSFVHPFSEMSSSIVLVGHFESLGNRQMLSRYPGRASEFRSASGSRGPQEWNVVSACKAGLESSHS